MAHSEILSTLGSSSKQIIRRRKILSKRQRIRLKYKVSPCLPKQSFRNDERKAQNNSLSETKYLIRQSEASNQSLKKHHVLELRAKELLVLKVKVNISHLSQLDSVAQTFRCALTISLIATGCAGTELEHILNEKDIQLDILNRVQAGKPQKNDSRKEQNDLILTYHCEGIFSEMYELSNFPFDNQDLHLCLTLHRAVLNNGKLNETAIVLEKSSDEDSAVIQSGAFYDSNMWWLQFKPTFGRPLLSHITSSGTRKQYPILEILIHLKREPKSYFYNIILPAFTITSFAFTSWAHPPDDLYARNQITLSMLLSGIAYKFVISEKIPPVGYMTVLDKYILGCGFFLCSVYLENFFASRLSDFADNLMLVVLFVVWISFNVLALIGILKIYFSNSLNFTRKYEADDSKRGIQWSTVS